jgi:hypothetical protein
MQAEPVCRGIASHFRQNSEAVLLNMQAEPVCRGIASHFRQNSEAVLLNMQAEPACRGIASHFRRVARRYLRPFWQELARPVENNRDEGRALSANLLQRRPASYCRGAILLRLLDGIFLR